MIDNGVQAGVGTATLSSDLDTDGPFTVHGVAIGSGDVTIGKSGTKKKWTGDALKKVADTLDGQPLVTDHDNNTDGTIGTVINTTYKEGVGVLYEAEIAPHYEEKAQDIAAGILDVSPRIYHKKDDQLESDEETGALVIDEEAIGPFDNLSVVSDGASPSNSIDIGEATAMASGTNCGAVAVLEQGSERPDADDVRDEFDFDSEELKHGRHDLGDLIGWGDENAGIITGILLEDNVPTYRVRHAEYTESGLEVRDETSEIVADSAKYTPRHNRSSEDTAEAESGHDDTDDFEELATSTHRPSFDGTVDQEWSEPDLSEFISSMNTDAESWSDLSEDQQSSIAGHFIVSKSGFPPENFGDLALPVVEVDGQLNLNALSNAKARAGQVSGVSEDEAESIENMIDELANDNFEDASFGEEEDMASGVEDDTQDQSTDEATSMDDEPETTSVASTMTVAALTNNDTSSTTMTDHIEYDTADESEIEDLDDPVVIEQSDVEDLREKASRAEELDGRLEDMNETLGDFAEAKEKLDEVDEDILDDVREYDDPVVLTDDEHEELTNLVDEVGRVYAEELADHSAFEAEELQERWTPFELKEKVEEHDDAELSSGIDESEEDVDPKGGASTDDSNNEAEELSEDDVREKIATGFEEDGLDRQADKVRSGQIGLEELGVDVSEF